jgi:hypothetical protein
VHAVALVDQNTIADGERERTGQESRKRRLAPSKVPFNVRKWDDKQALMASSVYSMAISGAIT